MYHVHELCKKAQISMISQTCKSAIEEMFRNPFFLNFKLKISNFFFTLMFPCDNFPLGCSNSYKGEAGKI